MVLAELRSRLDDAARRHGVPGAAVAVGRDGELAEAATGVVNRDTGVAATPDTVFQIGSVTKVWTAVLVMQLVDEGLVDLDRPVREYLPAFAVADPEAGEVVTVRQLLAHTGGFAGDLFEDTGRGDDALDRYLAFLPRAAEQVHPPGELFSYCNSGFSVLGALVARLRGGLWETVLRERLAGPLGVRHLALLAEEAILFRASAGHVKLPGADEYTVFHRWQLPRSGGPAGATPCAAPRELVRFGRFFLDGGVTGDGTRLLSAEALAAMMSPQVEVPGVPLRGIGHRGLGFVLGDWGGTRVLGHDGGTLGQHAMWRVLPEHGLVVAASANGGAVQVFFDELLDGLVAELTGVVVPPRPTPPAEPATVPDLDRYAGRYTYPLLSYGVVAADGGLDVTTTPTSFSAELDPPRTRRFVPLADDTVIAAEPQDGIHQTLTFLADGRYLHGNGRAALRRNGSGSATG
jgi:CubicO group peptidase (beta-lactamase class C family)